MELLAEDSPVVVRDVFPAEVATPDGMIRTARAVVTLTAVHVWIVENGEPSLVLSERIDREASTLAPPSAPRSSAHHLVLDGGTAATVHVSRQRGCGCGNPLKSWQPWTPYRRGPA